MNSMAASYEKSLLKSAVEQLSVGEGTGLVLLKVIYSNGHLNSSFTESFCEVELEPDTLFYFLSIFRRGALIIKNLYDSLAENVEQSSGEEQAVQKLLSFLDNFGAHGRHLASRKSRSEIEWTLQLCKHLFQELGSDEFIVDELSRDLGKVGSLEYRVCPCCQERLIGGVTNNTYIGHRKVWNGRLDVVLLGPDGNAVMPINVESSLEIKYGRQSTVGKAQTIAQSVVFSYFIKKVHPNLRNFLIPTITITKDEVLFTFYDPVEDMLIQSESMNLFDAASDMPEQLRIDTVVAVWLVLNYRLFGSGVCLDMIETGYKANFLAGKTEALNIYNNDLEFGVTIQSESLQSFACTNEGVYKRTVKGDK
ncbi:uncharacterized protein LOC123538584 [Mercenaria mercenaria]|uniref:uncharacterized protein LOC123538584 n=1 Tax=Mercenaria mercenaria TaxID=6596 RepID=UPI00234F0DF5|nr:uncharacterized protein LOC123538584 [Mercenaria mercenaria]